MKCMLWYAMNDNQKMIPNQWWLMNENAALLSCMIHNENTARNNIQGLIHNESGIWEVDQKWTTQIYQSLSVILSYSFIA